MTKTIGYQVELIGGPLCGRRVDWGLGPDEMSFIYSVQGKDFFAFYKLEDGCKTAFYQRMKSA